MSQMKKNDAEEKGSDLKRADSKKPNADGKQSTSQVVDFFGGKKFSERLITDSHVRVKKKIPLAVDIIVGILLIAIVCAALVGAYLIFRYYANDYGGVDVEYILAVSTEKELADFVTMKNKDLFCDIDGNAVHFGKIIEVNRMNGEGNSPYTTILLTVRANVKYRSGEGYSIGDDRLAVGGIYTLRCGNQTMIASTVELGEISK